MYQHSRRGLARGRSTGALTAGVGIFGNSRTSSSSSLNLNSDTSVKKLLSSSAKGDVGLVGGDRAENSAFLSQVGVAGVAIAGILATSLGIGIVNAASGLGSSSKSTKKKTKRTGVTAGTDMNVHDDNRGVVVVHRGSASSIDVSEKETGSASSRARSEEETSVIVVPGLPNVGNSCFANALFQAIASLSTFRDYLWSTLQYYGIDSAEDAERLAERGRGSLIAALALCLNELSPRSVRVHANSGSSVCTSSFMHSRRVCRPSATRVFTVLRIMRNELGVDKMNYLDQQDAQEMMHYLMDLLEKDTRRLASAARRANDDLSDRCARRSESPRAGLSILSQMQSQIAGGGDDGEIAPADEGGGGSRNVGDEAPALDVKLESEPKTYSRTDEMKTSATSMVHFSVVRDCDSTATRPPRNPLQGLMASTLRCVRCGRVSPMKVTPFFDLSMMVPESTCGKETKVTSTVVPRVGLFLGADDERARGRHGLGLWDMSSSSSSSSNCVGLGVGGTPIVGLFSGTLGNSVDANDASKSTTPTLRDCLRNFTAEERMEKVECALCKMKHDVADLRRRIKRSDADKNLALSARLKSEADMLQMKLRACASDAELRNRVPRDSCRGTSSSGTASPAIRRDVLSRAPAALCLHVRRRAYCSKTGSYVKVRSHVKFDLILQVSPFFDRELIHTGASGSGGLPPYRLQAVIVHGGSAHQGHYVAYRRVTVGSREVWMYASDMLTRTASVSEVLRSQCYMLFYEKVAF